VCLIVIVVFVKRKKEKIVFVNFQNVDKNITRMKFHE
jgi:hypothetical protein